MTRHKASRKHANQPAGGATPRRAARVRADTPGSAAAHAPAPAFKGKLAAHIPEIKRRSAAGESYSSIGRVFGASHSAVRAIIRGEAYKRGWGTRRQSFCAFCRGPVRVEANATRLICDACSGRAADLLTVYDRDKGIGEVPDNLKRRYLQS